MLLKTLCLNWAVYVTNLWYHSVYAIKRDRVPGLQGGRDFQRVKYNRYVTHYPMFGRPVYKTF